MKKTIEKVILITFGVLLAGVLVKSIWPKEKTPEKGTRRTEVVTQAEKDNNKKLTPSPIFPTQLVSQPTFTPTVTPVPTPSATPTPTPLPLNEPENDPFAFRKDRTFAYMTTFPTPTTIDRNRPSVPTPDPATLTEEQRNAYIDQDSANLNARMDEGYTEGQIEKDGLYYVVWLKKTTSFPIADGYVDRTEYLLDRAKTAALYIETCYKESPDKPYEVRIYYNYDLSAGIQTEMEIWHEKIDETGERHILTAFPDGMTEEEFIREIDARADLGEFEQEHMQNDCVTFRKVATFKFREDLAPCITVRMDLWDTSGMDLSSLGMCSYRDYHFRLYLQTIDDDIDNDLKYIEENPRYVLLTEYDFYKEYPFEGAEPYDSE